MKKPLLWLAMLVLVLSTFLAACSGGEKEKTTADPKDDDKDKAAEETGPQEGGTLTYALSSEFKGLLNWNFYDADGDDDIIAFFDDALIDYDENLKAQPNIASWTTDDNKVFKIGRAHV